MYLINPYYVISNVLYIKPKRSYIMIEKSCWNTMVSLIFRGRRPEVDELRKLKELCYYTYVLYMNTKNIDYHKFNSVISKLQGTEEELEKLGQQYVPSPEQVSIVEVETMEEGFFVDDDYLVDHEEEEEDKALTALVKHKEEFLKRVNQFINFSLSYSKNMANLVNLIGYSRLLNLGRQLYVDRYVKHLSKDELNFFITNVSFLKETLSFIQYSAKQTPNHVQYYGYFCQRCGSINTHNYAPTRVAIREDIPGQCAESMIFFDREEKYERNEVFHFNQNFFKVRVSVKDEVVEQYFYLNSDLKASSFVSNVKKIASVKEEYALKFQEIANQMKIDEMISEYDGNSDNLMTNYYATIKAYESVYDKLELLPVSFSNNVSSKIEPSQLGINIKIDEDSFSKVKLVKRKTLLFNFGSSNFSNSFSQSSKEESENVFTGFFS